MANCSSCGRHVEEYELHYADGVPVCISCESEPASGAGSDVPCQRCGVYVPPHELKMFRSRLYCNYCIMDMEDEARAEEKRMKKRIDGESGQEEESKKPAQDGAPRDFPLGGSCEFCGASIEVLYSFQGKKICKICLEKSGGEPQTGTAGFFGSAIRIVQKLAEKMQGKNIIVNVHETAQTHMDAIDNFMRENSGIIQNYPVQIEETLLDYAKKLSLEEKARFYEGYITLIFSDDEEFSLGMRACALPPQRLSGLIRAIYFLAPEREGCPKIPKKVPFEKIGEMLSSAEKRK